MKLSLYLRIFYNITVLALKIYIGQNVGEVEEFFPSLVCVCTKIHIKSRTFAASFVSKAMSPT